MQPTCTQLIYASTDLGVEAVRGPKLLGRLKLGRVDVDGKDARRPGLRTHTNLRDAMMLVPGLGLVHGFISRVHMEWHSRRIAHRW